MPTLTGSVADVTGVALAPGQIRQVFVKAPGERPSLADGGVLIVSAPVQLGSSGSLSVALEPGPAVLTIDTYAGGPDVYDLYVTSDMTLLSEAVDEAAPEHDRLWAESVMVQLRHEAVAAAARAEQAAEDVDAAIAGAADQVVQAVEGDRILAEAARTGAVEAQDAAEDAAGVAARHAGTADSRASEAGLSEANAKLSETNAGLSEQAASGHELAAEGFRDGALTARDEARTARDQADGFRNEAGTHAATATDKATEAGAKAAQAADFTTSTRTYRDQAEAARDIAVANGLRWRGTWAAGTAYVAQDVVTHAGSSWRAIDASTGVEPTEGGSWSLVAARGAPGQSGSTEITWGDIPDKPLEFTPEEHSHGPEDLGSGGTLDGSTFLNGLGNWVTPYTVMSSAEADEGTGTTPRVLSAARLREVIQQRVTGAAGTAVSLIGQAINRATTMAEARSAIGAVADDDERLSDPRTPTTHKHPVPDGLTASGTPSATTYLRGDGSWQTPPDTNTTYAAPTQAEAEAGTATTGRAFSAERVRQAVTAHPRLSAAPATWRWNGTSLPTAASQVHAQARAGDFIVAPNLTTDPGWHQITGV